MTEKPLPNIRVECSDVWGNGDIACVALDEDGQVIAHHISSSAGWARHDMGLTGNWKHDLYKARYPDGYALVDAIDAKAIEDALADMRLASQ